MQLKAPLFVALDTDDIKKIHQIVDVTGSRVGGFKIGPRLVLQHGPGLISEMARKAPVFYDPKYFDIPSTMIASVRSAFGAGASFVTVHALSGKKALTEMSQLEEELNQIRPFKILAVTVLTSWDETQVPANWVSQPIAEHVKALGNLVQESGLTGLVCSPHEISLFAKKTSDLFIVTPGIRLEAGASQDQVRVMTPAQAINHGASALVVGRPIVEASDPVEVIEKILASL